MAKSSNQKLKILYLMKNFMEKTDDAHSVSISEIISSLQSHGVKAERKSIALGEGPRIIEPEKVLKQMQEAVLFTIDKKDYTDDMPLIERFGVRALICRDGLWAMQIGNDGIYKIPGGGIEGDETYEEALIREVQEETGLLVIEDSIKSIGEVVEIREDIFKKGHKYIAHSFFYFCDAKDEMTEMKLTKSEMDKGYRLEWVKLGYIIETNERLQTEDWTKRDTMFLKWLKERVE